MTGYKILEDDRNEEEIVARDQEVYKASEDDNSKVS